MADVAVRDLMQTEVPTAAPDTRVGALARLMVEHGVPGIPIIDQGELVGIVTEADLIQREAEVDVPKPAVFFDAVFSADAGVPLEEELRKVTATTAGELMSAPVISILESATLDQLATLIIQYGVNPVPVVNDDRQIVGLATRRGLIEMIARLETGEGAATSRR
ncbi:MAG: CBS domain-containing protein [Thermomicrobiales bacterium]